MVDGLGDFFGLGRVLRMPARGLLRCPFDVAGERIRYLRTKSVFIKGIPSSWLLAIACSNVGIVGLKNAWCMYSSCCCLYGSVYRLFAACCCLLGHCRGKSRRRSVLSLLVGLMGSFHIQVFLSRPPVSMSSPL